MAEVPAPALRRRLDCAAWNCADSCAVDNTEDDEVVPTEPEPESDGLVEDALCTLVIELPNAEAADAEADAEADADAETPPSRVSGAPPGPDFFFGPSVGEYLAAAVRPGAEAAEDDGCCMDAAVAGCGLPASGLLPVPVPD